MPIMTERLREETGVLLPPMYYERYHRHEGNVRQVLGKQAFADAWANGGTMTLERTVEYVLASNPTE
jgi:hypothetical protein